MVENVVRILNVDIHSITQQELLQNLKKGIVITPNVDHLVKLQKDAGFYAVYQKADWVICDSKVLYLMSKLLRKNYLKQFLVLVSLLLFINIIKMIKIVEYFFWERQKEWL